MANENDVQIQSVRVKIGGKEHDLTLEQARKLHQALEGVFGKPPTYSGICLRPHADEWVRPWWNRPWVTYAGTADTIGSSWTMSVDLDNGTAGVLK